MSDLIHLPGIEELNRKREQLVKRLEVLRGRL